MKDEKKSIIKEALVDYETIQQAAEANAKKRLADEFPEKFNNLLKEELNKNKKSVKESYKKLDASEESEKSDKTEEKKESVMKNQEKETKKVVKETAGAGKPFAEKAKVAAQDVAKVNEVQVEEDVKITDTVGKGDPFKEKAKGQSKDTIDEEREKDFVGDAEAKTPNLGKGGEAEKGKVFNEKIKGPTSGKPISNLTEEFDITELDTNSVDNAIGSADGNDQILTMEDIEREISDMQGLGEELKGINATSPSYMEKGNKGIAFDQLVKMREQIDEVISSLGGVQEQKNNGGQGANKINAGGPTTAMIDEKSVDEMHQGNFPLDKMHKGEYDSKLIDEEQPITDKDVEDVLGGGSSQEEQPVEEGHGLSYSVRRANPGRHLPGNEDYLSQGEKDQAPTYTVAEAKKRISGLIKENKGLTKKLNEVKEYKSTVGGLLEQYKTALDKYRNQLQEMAIFNTNLAHVNNLLVNEELALTQDDKIKIINEFKKVNTIAESQKKYKAVFTEMKESRKTLTESVEEKVTTSIQPSSKQKLDEVTAYEDNKHIQKMKHLIEYVENRGKKIIK